MKPATPQTILLLALALVCFAANSILCRLALATRSIDPASFTAVRLASGAAVLALIVLASNKKPGGAGNWISASMLFLYAIAFSMAYIGIKAGTGALLLFGSVQATMIAFSMAKGHHPRPQQWLGLLLAIGGLVYLVLPSLSAPPLDRALMMAGAGIAWGIYSIRGAGGSDPVEATAGNFLRAAPLTLLPLALNLHGLHENSPGLLLAAVSGAVTSGLGYVFWYAALPFLGSIRAAIVQLAVPVLAAAATVFVLHESLTIRLAVASVVTLGGVAIAVLGSKGK